MRTAFKQSFNHNHLTRSRIYRSRKRGNARAERICKKRGGAREANEGQKAGRRLWLALERKGDEHKRTASNAGKGNNHVYYNRL